MIYSPRNTDDYFFHATYEDLDLAEYIRVNGLRIKFNALTAHCCDLTDWATAQGYKPYLSRGLKVLLDDPVLEFYRVALKEGNQETRTYCILSDEFVHIWRKR